MPGIHSFPLLGIPHITPASKGSEATRTDSQEIVFDPLAGLVHITASPCKHNYRPHFVTMQTET